MEDLGTTMSERNPAVGQLEIVLPEIQYMTINGFIILIINGASNVDHHGPAMH